MQLDCTLRWTVAEYLVKAQRSCSSLHAVIKTSRVRLRERSVRHCVRGFRENRGYASFDDFLMALKQSKRKNIRQERKHVAASGCGWSGCAGRS